jgi:hypothetical protein
LVSGRVHKHSIDRKRNKENPSINQHGWILLVKCEM